MENTQARQEDEILKLRQDVRDLKAQQRNGVWTTLVSFTSIVVFVILMRRMDTDQSFRVEDPDTAASTSLAQNRLIMNTSTSAIEVTNFGAPVVVFAQDGLRFVLAIEDGRLIAQTKGEEGNLITEVLVDRKKR